jgi:hypothetical protein
VNRSVEERLCACVAFALFIGCGGKLITLGEAAPTAPRFESVHLVLELSGPEKTDNPTLTSDLLEIFFTCDRGGNSDVWTAKRAAATDSFSTATRVDALGGSIAYESSSAVALDGLTLWFGSDRAGGAGLVDIWVSTRGGRAAAWSTPTNIAGLNSPVLDIPRPPGMHGLVMPMASTRATDPIYQTFFAVRDTTSLPFGTPQSRPDLNAFSTAIVDGFLTDDGLALFFTGGDSSTGAGDLFVARRHASTDPFTVVQPLTDLNTSADERDPWMSPDGTRFFFASDRTGVVNIYEASVKPAAP